MLTIREYHRPESIDEALALLARDGVDSAVLAGGTLLNGLPDHVPEEVIDLQLLGLSQIDRDGSVLEIGATATLTQLARHEVTPQVLADLARREAPNTIRNAATVGGTVAAVDPESVLLAGLLAYRASVTITDASGASQIPLTDFLASPSTLEGALITLIRVPIRGRAVVESTARTRADKPIVLVVGHRSEEEGVTLAATGVAGTPVVVDVDRLDELDPPADFRGSSEYRRHVARVLATRVLSRFDGDGET